MLYEVITIGISSVSFGMSLRRTTTARSQWAFTAQDARQERRRRDVSGIRGERGAELRLGRRGVAREVPARKDLRIPAPETNVAQ